MMKTKYYYYLNASDREVWGGTALKVSLQNDNFFYDLFQSP